MSNVENNTVYQNNENSSIFKLNVTANCHGSVPYCPIPQLAGIPAYCCFRRKTRPLSDNLAERGCRRPYILVKRIVLVELELIKVMKCWKGGALLTAPGKCLTFHSAKLMIEIHRGKSYSVTPRARHSTVHLTSNYNSTPMIARCGGLPHAVDDLLGQRLDTKSIY